MLYSLLQKTTKEHGFGRKLPLSSCQTTNGGSSSLPSHAQAGSQCHSPCQVRREQGQGSQPIPRYLPQDKSQPCHLHAVSSLLNLLMEKEMLPAEKPAAPSVVTASLRQHVPHCAALQSSSGTQQPKMRDAASGVPRALRTPYSTRAEGGIRDVAITTAEEAPCPEHKAVNSIPTAGAFLWGRR